MKRLLPFVSGALLVAGCSGHQVHLEVQAPATLHAEVGGYDRATVTRVVDGDTIEVLVTAGAAAGKQGPARVRLLGIDTPESVDPQRPVECFGREATAAATAFLENRRVTLVKDVEEVDDFGRLLRYVYVGQEMANARLVANGYATAYTYPPNVRHSELFVKLQRAARAEERGLWSPETCDGES